MKITNYLFILLSLFILWGNFFESNCIAADPQTFKGGMGLYGFLPVEVDASDYRVTGFLENHQFEGVSLRVKWSTIEQTEGDYNWNYIDSILSRVQCQGKRVIISILTGYLTPSWVYSAGANAFSYFDNKTGRQEIIPIPWDAIYHEKLENLIAALGKKYNNHPNIFLIHVSGPMQRSVEMHLPKSAEDKTRWEQIGYTPEKLIDAWKRVLTYYDMYLPNKIWSINLQIPIWNDGVVEAVADHCANTYPWQCGLQIDFWKDNNSTTYPPTAKIIEFSDNVTYGGLQGAGCFPQKGGDVNIAIQNAIKWRTLGWNEVYYWDKDELDVLYNEIQIYKQINYH